MNLTVGLAGSGADVIVSGTAEDEVNQALADVGASGGGSVTLLGGLYSIASSISMTYSNVTLQGAGAGQTILRTVPAFAAGTSMIAAVGIDDFTIQNLTVDGHTNDTRANGVTTTQCTNGTVAGCEVLLSEAHNYGIWVVLSDHVDVLNNIVDGTTPAPGQEGIETWSSDNVLMSGNTIRNLGGAAFNLGSLPTAAYGDIIGENANLQVIDNFVDNVLYGTSIGISGPRSFGQIEISGNTFTNIGYGVRVLAVELIGDDESESATLAYPQHLHDISISNNEISFASGSSGSGIFLQNESSPDVISFSNITASGNVITDAPGRAIEVQGFDHFTLDGNVIAGTERELGGSPYDDFILGSNLANLLSGEAGADAFVFGANALTPVYSGAKVVDHILDYNQGDNGTFNAAEGDAVDVSALLSAGSGQPVANLVRVVQNDGRTLAVVQVDRDGSANGSNWTTVALLDGVAAGSSIKVIYNSSQPAATLSVQAGVTVNVDPEVGRPAGGSVSATKAQTLEVSSLFSGSDADGDTLTYYLYDTGTAANSGYFLVGGNRVAAGTVYQLSAAQFAQATFVAGAAGTSDSIYVQAFDGIAYSGWETSVNVSVPANRAPTVSRPAGANVAPTSGQTMSVSSLFSGSDLDGDTLTYFLYDGNSAANSGRFMVGGNAVAAGTIVAVTAAQLAEATFVAGAAGTSDSIAVQAYDGTAYSGWNAIVNVAVPAGTNHAPTVSTPAGTSIAPSAGQTIQVSSLFSGNDVDGNTLTYYLYDSNSVASSGHFVVGGNIVPAGTIYWVSAAQLAQATFVAGAAGTSDSISVQASDGAAYSGWNATVNVAVPAAINHAPTVSLPSGIHAGALAGQSLQLSSMFAGNDVDGDTLTYFLYDANTSASSGHFMVGGNVVPAATIYTVTAAQLAQATFVAGAAGMSDDIFVQAFDGKLYSGWNTSVHVTATGVNHAPTVSLPSGSSVNSLAGQSLQLSSLFAGNDVDGNTLSYYVYDANSAANSGHFVIGGNVVAGQTISAMTATQLATATFVAGAAGTFDDIYVQAYDGQSYSGWNSTVHVTATAPNNAPTVDRPAGSSVGATAGQSLQLSTLFSGSDIDGNTLSYYIYDANSAANSGHFVVGGNIVAGQTITAMTAAQLAQATFVAGDAGTFDDIYVQAFDGQLYSGWNSTVHVTAVAPNNAPTVDRPAGTNIGATAGQTLQLSSLFAGNDLDGDPLSYFVYDNNAAANGGHVEIGGNVVTALTITAMSAAELAQATFVAGDAGTADDIFVQAFDGKAYSGWTTGVHIFV